MSGESYTPCRARVCGSLQGRGKCRPEAPGAVLQQAPRALYRVAGPVALAERLSIRPPLPVSPCNVPRHLETPGRGESRRRRPVRIPSSEEDSRHGSRVKPRPVRSKRTAASARKADSTGVSARSRATRPTCSIIALR